MRKKSQNHSTISYVSRGRGLHQDADGDRGDGDGDGARVSLAAGENAKIVVVGVDNTSQILSGDGQLGGSNHGDAQGTGTGRTDVLTDAQRVRRDREVVNRQVGGASSAVGERLGVGNGGNNESSDGSKELHGWRVAVVEVGTWCVLKGLLRRMSGRKRRQE